MLAAAWPPSQPVSAISISRVRSTASRTSRASDVRERSRCRSRARRRRSRPTRAVGRLRPVVETPMSDDVEIDLLVRHAKMLERSVATSAIVSAGSSIAARRFDRSRISCRAKNPRPPSTRYGISWLRSAVSKFSIPVRVGEEDRDVAERRPRARRCFSSRTGQPSSTARRIAPAIRSASFARATSAESAGSARITQIERLWSASPAPVATSGTFAGWTPGDATSTRSNTSLTQSMTPAVERKFCTSCGSSPASGPSEQRRRPRCRRRGTGRSTASDRPRPSGRRPAAVARRHPPRGRHPRR